MGVNGLIPTWMNVKATSRLTNIPAIVCLQIFHGNTDATEVVLNRIPQPVLARFVRIRPQTWKNGIALRFELYGCQITGQTDLLSSLGNRVFLLFL